MSRTWGSVAFQALNPDVIFCKLDCFSGPRPGPRSDYVGYDDLVQAATGIMLRFGGSMDTPEEHAPPRIAGAADREAEELRASGRVPDGIDDLLSDPPALARHLAWLDPATSRRLGEPDAPLANALLKLSDGMGPEALDDRETFAVLASPRTLADLRRR